MQPRKVAIIFNPKGGSAREAILQRLVSTLVALGIEVRCTPTTAAPGSARILAAAAATDRADLVIAVGGDGTAREVAEGLVGTDVVMAVYPGGTGNLFAQYFYGPPTPEAFAKMLVHGHPQPIDLLKYECRTVEGRTAEGIFMVGLGFGPLSDAISDASPFWKRKFKRLVYVANVARAACWLNSVPATVSIDGASRVIEGNIAAAFALNVLPHWAPSLSRGCSPNDGLIDLVAVKGRHFYQVFGCGMCLTAMRPDLSRYYARVRSNDIRITIAKPIVLNVDGDPGPKTDNVRLSVLPGAARMILA